MGTGMKPWDTASPQLTMALPGDLLRLPRHFVFIISLFLCPC